VAIASACGLPIAVAGTASYMLLGWNREDASEWIIGYVYLPAFTAIVASSIFLAPVGARLAHSLPTEKLKRFFAVFLFFVGIKILWW
ncbi:MAG: sulfite exporter TauE/SafE family protein, partial [Gammaproteobacteria bacterium]